MNNRGFTLIEVVIVSTLLGLLSLSALTSLRAFKDRSEATICEAYCRQLELIYQTNLLIQPDSDYATIISEHSQEISCPSGGDYTFLNKRVYCSRHK